ncbi:MAG: hypothetical protein HW376_1725 [candidate division NC10 bacterium]|nr:hypothetical protein [candidate division NC10 bacterium]
MDDLAQREIDGGVVEEALGRFLDKPYDEINPTTQVSQSPEEGTGEGQRDRRNDILEEVSGQAQLGEDQQVGAAADRLLGGLLVHGQVPLQVTERGANLCEGDRVSAHAIPLRMRVGARSR